MNDKKDFQEFTPENARFLEREEEEFLKSLETSAFIKNFLENIFCNSAGTFLTLYCINLGLGIIASVLAGFSIGSFSGLKDIYKSATLKNKDGVDFQMLRGLIKLVLLGGILISAVGEWKTIETMAEKSAQFYRQDIDRYQRDGGKGLDPNITFLIYVAGGAAVGVVGINLLKSKI
jgi:hypothetical protein